MKKVPFILLYFENIKFNGKNKIGNWKSIYKDSIEPKFGWI